MDSYFKQIGDEIVRLLIEKNNAYGNSSQKTYEKYGLESYLIRMEDKINRLENLSSHKDVDNVGESIEDTLKDLAGYAILAIIQERYSNRGKGLTDYAKKELNLMLEKTDPNDEEDYRIQKAFNDSVLEVIETFSKQGHSGLSAQLAIDYVDRLLHFRPLTKLKYTEDEWTEVSDGIYQNKRASNVFRDKNKFNGEPYCLDGPDGKPVSLLEKPYAYWGIFDDKKDE